MLHAKFNYFMYTCVCDISCREIQKLRQFAINKKSLDSRHIVGGGHRSTRSMSVDAFY